MLNHRNTLLCVFSFNMGRTLGTCLESTFSNCAGFPVVLMDDNSTDETTLAVIEEYRSRFLRVFVSKEPKGGRRHGNLYSNIQRMCAFAGENGYDYLFMIQDDMQFVRPMDEAVCEEYAGLFRRPDVLQVDPRFLRRGAEYDILEDLRAYCFPPTDDRRSYADVGILNLSIIRDIGWRFLDSERANKEALTALGYRRLFPFTPIVMHVPFPKTYRKGRARWSLFPFNRGRYQFHSMTAGERAAMDSRDLAVIPYFRDFLRPKNMLVSRLYYSLRRDGAVFR